MNFNTGKLKSQLRRHEGLRLHTYLDSEGVPTIGYGKNLLALKITQATANQWLEQDIQSASEDLDRVYPFVSKLSEPRQRVLVNMAFNLGITRLMGFKRMWAALERRDYIAAAEEMLDSKWARQVGSRADELSKMMEMG